MISRLVIACLTRVRMHRVSAATGRGRRGRLLGVALVASLALLASLSATAFAHIAHEKLSSFPSHGVQPTGIAINQSTHDVYVDHFNGGAPGTIFEFNADGSEVLHGETPITGESTPAGSFGGHGNIAIDNSSGVSAGDLYVPDESHGVIDKFTAEGVFLCELDGAESPCSATKSTLPFGSPEAVAVDPKSGVVYVPDRVNNLVDVFAPSGAYLGQIAASNGLPLQNPRDIKVDASGDVFVASEGAGVPFAVVEFKPSSEPATGATTWSESVFNATENAAGIGIDGAGDVFVSLANAQVQQFSPAGAPLSEFAGGGLSFGLAVSEATNDLYVTLLGENSVAIFDTFNAATVTTGASTELTHTSATAHGSVNPEGLTVTKCEFKYGSGLSAPCDLSGAEIGTGNAPVAVSAKLEGLEPATKYPVALAVEVEGHADQAAGSEFETVPLITLTAEAASALLPESATLNATFVPQVPGEVEYFFEYGKEEPFTKTPARKHTVLTLGESVKVQEPVTGLEPQVGPTAYGYRLVAIVEGHTFTSEQLSFETPPVVTATSEAVSALTAEGATLNAKVNVLAGTASYYFEYGAAEPFTKTTEQTLGLGEHSVSAPIGGLTPNRPYHFRIVAVPSNPNTPIEGALEEFTTKVGLPLVTGESASKLQRHSASVAGEVNPQNGETSYTVEYADAQSYAKTGAYDHATPTGTIGAGEAGTTPLASVPIALNELKAGTVYHYRIVASNAGGSGDGPDQTFTTLPGTPPLVETESANGVGQTSASLSTTLNPSGLQTSYAIELGSEVAPGLVSYTPTYGNVGSGSSSVGVTLTLTGLQPGSTYHYRIVAHNEDGTTTGADQTFTTSGFSASILAPAPVTLIPYTAPVEPPPGKGVTVKSLTRAQKLAKALKQCGKQPKRKRAACVKSAHKHYGPVKSKSSKRSKR